jgi:sulfate adenylyltransferase
MTVEEVFSFDRDLETSHVLGTTDVRHPLVAEMHRWGKQYISGPLRVLRLPRHDDFLDLRMSPLQTRAMLKSLGKSDVVAFQTRNPLHRAHEEMTKRAIAETGGTLLLQPVVGMTKPGDVDHFTRVRTYRALVDRHYPRGSVVLALLPLAMRMAGPREAVWHALIRRNYGANHFIVGRDHASPGVNSEGKPFYGPYDAQKLVGSVAEEIGVQPRFYNEFVYLPAEDRYEEASRIPKEARTQTISGTQVRDEYLNRGRALPAWFTRPEVASILAESYPPRHKQGICIWFTGLSGAGKTATAEILVELLMEHGRQSTMLDGDVVRTHLSAGLGFSRQDRDVNIRRIGFVAAEVVRHGGIAVCAAVSPYRAARNDVRNMMNPGEFIEIFVDTPLEICEQRDTKGMYAKARRGEISGFTGVDDPYEEPLNPEIRLETIGSTAAQNARRIFDRLRGMGLVRHGDEISVG